MAKLTFQEVKTLASCCRWYKIDSNTLQGRILNANNDITATFTKEANEADICPGHYRIVYSLHVQSEGEQIYSSAYGVFVTVKNTRVIDDRYTGEQRLVELFNNTKTKCRRQLG